MYIIWIKFKTVMVYNSNNINNTNNHLSRQINEYKKDHKGVGNIGPGLRNAQKCDRLNR